MYRSEILQLAGHLYPYGVFNAINETDFYSDFVTSKIYLENYETKRPYEHQNDPRFDKMILPLLQKGFNRDPKVRKEAFDSIRRGEIFPEWNNKKFKKNLQKEVYRIVMESRLPNCKYQ